MGNSASKSAAKAVKPLAAAPPAFPYAKAVPKPAANEAKNAAIEQDGQDPNYLANLTALGAVIVPKSPSLFRPDNRMLDILKQRKAVEEEEEQNQLDGKAPLTNRLTAQSLSNLIDDRKSITSRKELERLCRTYGIEFATFEELGKHVSTPSVASIKSLQEDIEDTQMAKWAEAPPLVQDSTPQITAK